MRIGAGTGVPSFYNASSKINSIGNAEEINRAAESSQAQQQEKRNEASQYIAEHGGVIQTRVSPENAYQKAQLESPRARIEDMADKLVEKMPRIIEDMKRLVPDEETAAPSKTVVNENNAAAVAEKNAMKNELENFSIL